MRTRKSTDGEKTHGNRWTRTVAAALVVAAVLGLALATVPVGGAAGTASAAPGPEDRSPGTATANPSSGLAPGLSAADRASDVDPVAAVDGCGEATTTTHSGTLSEDVDRYTYSAAGADNCTVTVTLSGPSDADFDLYVAVDGRRVTPDDYDRKSTETGSAERIVLEESVVRDASEISILVHPYRGTGEYTLTIAPDATGGDAGAAPTPAIEAAATTVEPGTPVSLNASGSFDRDGSITEYRWRLGANATATGVSTTHAFEEPGTYAVTLTVTDDDGTSASTTETIAVESADSDLGPVDGWQSPRNPDPGETTVFVGEPLGRNVSEAEFQWDFDGDGETDATGRTTTHAFASAGYHDVTLTVDAGDLNKTYTTTVLVGSPEPADDGTGDESTGPGNVTAGTGDGLGDVSQPGFGPGAAVAALGLGLFGWRIHDARS